MRNYCLNSFIKQTYALLGFAIIVCTRMNSLAHSCMGTSAMSPSNTELHSLTSVQKWSQDFFERFPKSEWSYNIRVYGKVFCLDMSTRSQSFKVRIVAEQKWTNRSPLTWWLVLGPRIRRESRVFGTRMGLLKWEHFHSDRIICQDDLYLYQRQVSFQFQIIIQNL